MFWHTLIEPRRLTPCGLVAMPFAERTVRPSGEKYHDLGKRRV